jgi:hypothetical protein
MDKYAPKWRHGSEAEVEEAFRSWLGEVRAELLRLIAAHYRFNTTERHPPDGRRGRQRLTTTLTGVTTASHNCAGSLLLAFRTSHDGDAGGANPVRRSSCQSWGTLATSNPACGSGRDGLADVGSGHANGLILRVDLAWCRAAIVLWEHAASSRNVLLMLNLLPSEAR